jgi:hypothetical protein
MRFSLPTILFCLTAAPLGCGSNVIEPVSTGGSGGSTAGTGGAGGGDACPVLEPNDGDPCTTPGLTCILTATCCSPMATCSGGHWSVAPPDCQQPCLSCGPVNCGTNAVCINVEGGLSSPLQYFCAANPCDGQSPSCACAGSLCPSGCDGTDGQTLICH